MMSYDYPHPVSRTHQYKKITKPALERKRRARMNKCVEQLKKIMIDTLETEAENISKLEKADILELTVHHLQRLQSSPPLDLVPGTPQTEDITPESRWHSGFGHCAAEACKYLAAMPGEFGEKLARHLAMGLEIAHQLSTQSVSQGVSVPQNPTAVAHSHLALPGPPSPKRPSPSMVTSHRLSPTLPPTNASAVSLEPMPNKFCNSLERSGSPIPTATDDEEEIDVEGFDDNDPMWRPW
ncbi:enhancer of split mbeta protein-like [Diachasmimorpha longicaudata]|uniref:enhancer of split mbeta protein-like n=1 Tax=Diachasmimorpha longicaudata TaxID=58733 RepID=UPI0030B88A0E